ncbi:hypothetical protein PAPYR_12752 [Paratrimastix pyriformis]|uniref:Chromo domain-containing protein n=1 Tax=Paratrimastix pyriformis TaxID=342808 RepID=A0ABQ8U2X6_9EUKA|nr:hypothetical protein PAPYR_12752 [Paratrimastix pyriformis]
METAKMQRKHASHAMLSRRTRGRCSDTSQTYRGLSARALLITLLLDSEAAFDIDHPVEGPMRLDEIVLWERSYPFYLREQFPKVFLACEREYLSLSADERKTYDWSIQCHKFRTSTCSRELPTLWDFLLTGPLPLPLPVLVAEPEPVPESVPLPENVPVADDDEDEWATTTAKQPLHPLATAALKEGEYLVEEVFEHDLRDGHLWFRVKWVDYPAGVDEWVAYRDCRWAPAVKAYVKANNLHPTLRPPQRHRRKGNAR